MAPQKCLRFVVEFSSLESYNSSKTGSNLYSASYEDDRAPISLLGGAHSLSLPVLAWRADVRVSFLAPTDVFLVSGKGGDGGEKGERSTVLTREPCKEGSTRFNFSLG